jgi:hypothetical protein
MDSLTVSSSLLIPSAVNAEISPAMLAVLWCIADELDSLRVPANTDDAVWLTVPARQLRDPEGRDDNFWLKKCLDRLTGMKLAGEYRGDPWGAVILAQWEIKEGGSIVRLLIPPAAIQAIRSPKTFAKIEMTAAYRLKGHARRLYAALADKKRLGNPYWTYEIAELHAVFDTHGQYKKWYDMRRYVLDPAIAEINDYGTVNLKTTPQKTGRSVTAVRFDWEWKTLDEVRETDEENKQPKGARHMDRKQNDAPPLTDEERRKKLRDEHFAAWLEKNPGSAYTDFMQAPEYKQLRAELGYGQ